MMGERMRQLENQCLRKRAYPDRAAAELALKANRGMTPYHCPQCGQWHIGHAKRPGRRP